MERLRKFLLCSGVFISLLTDSVAVDTIAANQSIKDGDTLVSAGQNFELGFFSPNNSNSRYLGIRYKRISTGTVVWVANKDTPLNNTSGVFKLSKQGSLLLLSGGDTVIWSSGSANGTNVIPVAQLLETGNLVVRDGGSIDPKNIIWQSSQSYDSCVRNGICGPFGICNYNKSPVCGCIVGFEPRRPDDWSLADYSSGCVRRSLIDCSSDVFQKILGVKLPDIRNSWYNLSTTLEECGIACNNNCSCTAYANLDTASGCQLWCGDVTGIRENYGSRDIYIRMTATELGVPESGSNKKKEIIVVVLSISAGLILVGLTLTSCGWSKKKRNRMPTQGNPMQTLDEDYTNESHNEPAELPSFSLSKNCQFHK